MFRCKIPKILLDLPRYSHFMMALIHSPDRYILPLIISSTRIVEAIRVKTERPTRRRQWSLSEHVGLQDDDASESCAQMPAEMAMEEPHSWVGRVHSQLYVFPGNTCTSLQTGVSVLYWMVPALDSSKTP